MKEDRNVASGSAPLMSPVRRRNRSPSPERRMRRAADVTRAAMKGRSTARGGQHGLNQLIGEAGGIEVEQTGWLDTGRRGTDECSNG